MGIRTLRQDIEQLTKKVLHLTRENCWNVLPDEVVYIISEIEIDAGNWKKRFENRRSKDALEPMNFDLMISELEKMYPSLHDINLHVHRAEKYRTIIDVQYFLKEKVGYETKPETPSMLHVKVSLPPFRGDDPKKFDLHWGFGEI